MNAKWTPGDDELDAIARSMPVPDRGADRIEQERTSVLAQAAQTPQRRRGSRVPMIASAALAFAAAAAVILWFATRPSGPIHARESITALGPAQFERTDGWPDFKVRLEDGRIDVRVTKLVSADRFRVITNDAEVEVRGTQFVVGADHGSIASVSVGEGRVEVRWMQEQPVFLSAGQTWTPTRTAQRDEVELTPPTVQDGSRQQDAAPSTSVAAKPTTVVASKSNGSKSLKAATPDAKPQTTTAKPPQDTPKALPFAPGEADFRAGISSLRAGDANAAVTSFASACKAAEKEALGEDACFWLGAAANRAGQTSTAREALTRFLTTFPGSARTGEASALLGWLLYKAGELDAAQQRFELAARDRVAKVKESAVRGLEAIKRKRGSP